MDWSAVRFDWTQLRAFLVTVEEGSLSASARALGLTQPTLSRQVDALETALGLQLFERVGRGVRPTPAALELLPYAKAMGDAAFGIARVTAGQTQSVAGEVSISASDLYAALVLPPILGAVTALHPDLRFEIVVDNAASDLRRREADIAIRNFRPREGDLVARKIRTAQARLFGTETYLSALGHPDQPKDFSDAAFVEMGDGAPLNSILTEAGFDLQARNFPWRSSNFVVAWQLLRQGLALGLLDARIGDQDPHLVQACTKMEAVPFPVWLVAHKEVQTARRLRIVWEALAQGLR
ncbi:MAG: LysR family transcriptional regulator [Pseudomonadota bacterium]